MDDDISVQLDDEEIQLSDDGSIKLDDDIQFKKPKKKKGNGKNKKTTVFREPGPSVQNNVFKQSASQPVQNPANEFEDRTFEMLTNPSKRRPEEPPKPDFGIEEDDVPASEIDQVESDDDDQVPAFYEENESNEIQPADGFTSIEDEKQDIIYKLHRLEAKGRKIKKFNMHSDILEMRAEYNKIKKDIETNNSVKFSRRMLLTFVSGVEFANKTFDPIGAELNGWSESVMENLNDGDYDTIFERLHEKYYGKMNTPPEIELLLTLAGSAIMFHMTSKMFKGVPSMSDFAKKNPNFMNDIMQKMTANKQPESIPKQHQSIFGDGDGDDDDGKSSVLSFQSEPEPQQSDSVNIRQVTVSQTAGGTRRGRKPKIISTNENTIDI